MEITIKIDCDTINEFYSHLTKIRDDIRKETKRLKLNPHDDEFPPYAVLDDNNCYGTHYVEIITQT